MRAERLAWTDKPKATAEGRRESDKATPIVQPSRRKRFLHRSGIRVATRVVDALAVALVTLALCASEGVDVLAIPLAAALPYLMMPAMCVLGVWSSGGYRFRYAGSVISHVSRVAFGVAIAMGVMFVVMAIIDPARTSLFAQLCAVNALTVFALHANYLGMVRAATRKGQLSDNVVIVGATQAAARIVSRNVKERELNIVGFFDDRAGRSAATLMGDTPFLGKVEDLLTWEGLPKVDRIVVTVTSTAQARVRELIDKIRNLPQEIILVLDLDGFNPEQTSLARVVDAPAAYISGAPRDVRRAAVKQVFDVTVSASALIVLAIPMALIALLIKMDSKGPVFFRQKRHGFNNEIIRVWKFRTMRPDKTAEEGIIRQTQIGDPRVTKLGGFLRRTSLDELPQLFNVIKGEMSIVGPRPHAVGMTAGSIEVTRTVGDYAHRHRMKPGMTGWAQVNGSRGPCHTPEEVRERVRLDMDYVKRATIWLDAWIVLITVPCLLGDRQKAR
ncbi:MAG TPA: exopolysaccharide biosynthesis polyprenyl glycosylphosphotransferase [Hyphomonadaceae bacterium]|nr:exopolysaccharide biosynthesis polyprenyl glycosylphosphotransferase [Hyphomonadaceae bacterium]HPN06654.1 exopolysaccharide biosynthesis polyprenyl glycosylphosphotransferase [Hyphomonadaceae bacterium]